MKAGPSKLARTTELRAAKKRKSETVSLSAEEELNDDSVEKVHVIKKAAKKRAQGKLSELIDLPIDVLFEIFGHLKPFDLLKLARVTKQFRRLLMHRSSTSVWQTALERIPDLPPCPSDMDEPAWPWSKCAIRDHLLEMKDKAATITHDNARDTFLQKRRQLLAYILEHAASCAIWAKTQTSDRISELQQLRDERREAIIEKLVGLGYEKDIVSIRDPHSLVDHELVKKPQKLTDRVWANIRQSIIKFMDEMRAIRLEREHIQLLQRRKLSAAAVFRGYMIGHYPYTDVMPSGLDFCGFPPVEEILEQPDEVDVDETSFTDIVPLIPNFIARWRRSVDLHLREVAKSTIPYSKGRDWNRFEEFIGDLSDDGGLTGHDEHGDISSAKYKLATTVYYCSDCAYERRNLDDDYDLSDDFGFINEALHQPLFYPKVKGHGCLTRTIAYFPWSDSHNPEANDPARKLDGSFIWKRRQWSAYPLRVDPKIGDCVKTLVQMAGLDPETTTADEMDGLGLWFACLNCAHDSGGDSVKEHEDGHPYELHAFSWRLALEHFLVEHRSHIEPAWKKIDSEHIDEAVQAFKNNHKSTYDPLESEVIATLPLKGSIWSCIQCRNTSAEVAPRTLPAMNVHIIEEYECFFELRPGADSDIQAWN
ncbi:hypothetical protein DXG01_005498 [Tephrocybe rancida]|nr:hypothetical protein DXG01_005498 [Tephrocybe rancida]